MKRQKKTRCMMMLYQMLMLTMVVLTGCNQGGSGSNEPIIHEATSQVESQTKPQDEPITLPSRDTNNQITATIISDLHQLSPDLRADNKVFETFINSGDGKLLAYSTEILEALKVDIDTDILIVSGDLTTHGELSSHEWLANYFHEIEAKDIGDDSGTSRHTRVFVIPGNHDVNNPYARTFVSGKQEVTDTVSPDEFASIYSDFGYNEALSIDPSSLSYVVRLADDFYLVMLDTCKYEDNIALGYPVTGGELRTSTIEWLLDVDKQIKELSPKGAKVISSSHHNMLSHSPVHDRGFVIDNIQEGTNILDTMGIKLNFSGHIHIQDIISEGDLTEIATGSLLQYAQTYGVATFTDEKVDYHTQWIDMDSYAQLEKLTDPFLLDFKSHAREVFRENSVALIGERIANSRTLEEVEAMKTVFADLNEGYFAGTDSDAAKKETIRNGLGYALWMQEEEGFLGGYVESMLLDDTPDNEFSGDIK